MKVIDTFIRAAMLLLMLLLMVVFLTSVARGATLTPTIIIKWLPILTMADGSPIPANAVVTYQLYGSHSLTGPWSAPIVYPATATSAVRDSVALGLDCYYLVAAINNVLSIATAIQCVTMTATPSTVPSTPGGFQASKQ